jgi:hypothetical protein
MIEKLRDEIIESQKARTELMKWKLILVAAIGGASLGIGSNLPASRNPPYGLLALIPWVCLYVDAVCFHLELRILAIGRFIRIGGKGSVPVDSVARKYEEYCAEFRPTFSLEGFALALTTIAISILVLAIGWVRPDVIVPMSQPMSNFSLTAIKLSGILGIVGTLWFTWGYRVRSGQLDKA